MARSSRPREALAGIFVIEARDLEHALPLAKLTPIVDGAAAPIDVLTILAVSFSYVVPSDRGAQRPRHHDVVPEFGRSGEVDPVRDSRW